MNSSYPTYTSSVCKLGFIGDINKTSLIDRDELRKKQLIGFSDFILLEFCLRVRLLLSTEFLSTINKSHHYPYVSLFFFVNKGKDLNLNFTPEDYIQLNSIFGESYNISDYLDFYNDDNIIYSVRISSSFCFKDSFDKRSLTQDVINSLFASINFINSYCDRKINNNDSIFLVYHISYDSR